MLCISLCQTTIYLDYGFTVYQFNFEPCSPVLKGLYIPSLYYILVAHGVDYRMMNVGEKTSMEKGGWLKDKLGASNTSLRLDVRGCSFLTPIFSS